MNFATLHYCQQTWQWVNAHGWYIISIRELNVLCMYDIVSLRIWFILYYSVGFLHCPSRQLGNAKASSSGMGKANPTLFLKGIM